MGLALSTRLLREFCEVTGLKGFPGGASGKEPACQCRRPRRRRFDPFVRKIPWRSTRQTTPVFLPGEFPGQRSLVRYVHSVAESDMIEVTSNARTGSQTPVPWLVLRNANNLPFCISWTSVIAKYLWWLFS